MRAVGLVTEYNPFHNGHQYHLEQAKTVTNADVVIAVMSGNFVQRGEPAVIDKWRRTTLALAGGINLVLELPFAFAVQPAHLFAKGAVKILADAGVDTIAFGAEHADLDFLAIAKQAQAALQHQPVFKQDYTQTYATQFNDVVEQIVGFRIERPNDLLGLAYANAVLELHLGEQIQLQPIQRIGAAYHDQQLPEKQHIASATAIRSAMADHADLTPYMSDLAAQDLSQGSQVKSYETDWLGALEYKVQTTPPEALAEIYQLNDGLAYRLFDLIDHHEYQSMTQLLDDFKTKRYTRARLRRSLLYTILNVQNNEMQTALQRPYIRVLGMDQVGRYQLKQQRDQMQLPVVNRFGKQEIAQIGKLDYRAGKLYQLFDKQPNAKPQDTGRIPIFFER
ncbi:putative nucleotidyltransferase [Weissella uvarum]|uniref:nucleotidyltransferase n=1 Tax=Weissella uvarum TaxID=1479233 RepID=UPI001961EC50|nr:nucleotidyltransferase [Weissella uvarum]MBM7616488.1 putative nucleotidyltransferase [Weissella uvarum]MCM0595051.1 nucleotidyltransferase [Weissella uvarum]